MPDHLINKIPFSAMAKSRDQRHSDGRLTPLGLEVMKVLWHLGPANVRTVRGQIKKSDLAYTTVQTMLNILCRKSKVKRCLKNGVYFYDPLISRQEAATQALDDIIERFFDGSLEGLVLNLLEGRYLTAESLVQILNAGLVPEARSDVDQASGWHPEFTAGRKCASE